MAINSIFTTKNTERLIEVISQHRDIGFLEKLRQTYIETPSTTSEWMDLFDPNELRHFNVVLPPLYVKINDVFNAKYEVNINDHIGWKLYLHGYFDVIPTKIIELLMLCGYSGDYIDGGANIGTTTLPAALKGIKVFSVEASNSTAFELLRNISYNPSVYVTTINGALSSQEEVNTNRYSKIYSSNGNIGAASLHENWNTSGCQHQENCIKITLDSIIDMYKIKEILLIKLDIEGYEYFALKGFYNGLNSLHPPVLFEWRPDILLKSLGEINDIRTLFPKEYVFYTVQSVLINPREAIEKIAINLKKTDLSTASENVLALHKDHHKNPNIIKAITGYVTY